LRELSALAAAAQVAQYFAQDRAQGELAMKLVIRLALGLVLASASTAIVAQEADPESTYKLEGAKASKPVATIGYGPSALQVVDLRVPAGKGPFPVAIVIHGGCFMASVDNRRGIAGFADALTARGFATWNIEYRRVGDPGGGWPGTFQDIAAAVDKLADVAPKYKLDTNRVSFVGHSAGAYFALWAASRAKLSAPWNKARITPVAVAAIDGPGDLAPFVGIDKQVCGRPVIVPLMGGTPAERPEEYRIASPASRLPFGIPQILVGSDLADLMQPYIAAAKASGDSVHMLMPPNANHFDVVTPTTTNGKAVLDFVASNIEPPHH
jgi:acetyl esterase/lipase